MKRFLALTFCLALLGASNPPVAVESATGDWSRLQSLNQNGYEHLDAKVMARLYQIAKNGQCSLSGYDRDGLHFEMSFAAQFDPSGSVRRIVIPKLNCPEAEGIIGGALLAMIEAGDYRPTGKSTHDGWYRGEFAFGFE